MTKPQAAARLSAEIIRKQTAAFLSTEIIHLCGAIDRLHELHLWTSAVPLAEEMKQLRVYAQLLLLLVAKFEGNDPLTALVRTFDAEARAKYEKDCPCDGKPNMDPRCARQGMCMVEDGDGKP